MNILGVFAFGKRSRYWNKCTGIVKFSLMLISPLEYCKSLSTEVTNSYWVLFAFPSVLPYIKGSNVCITGLITH